MGYRSFVITGDAVELSPFLRVMQLSDSQYSLTLIGPSLWLIEIYYVVYP